MSKNAVPPVPGGSRARFSFCGWAVIGQRALAPTLAILAILSTHHPARANEADDWMVCAGRRSLLPAERLKACDTLLESPTMSAENKSRAWCNRAIANRELGNHAAAMKDVETAVNMSTDPYYSLLCRGNQYEYTGDLDRALADYDKAIALNPQRPEAFVNRGHNSYVRNDFQRALDDYKIATGLDPNSSSAFSARGLAQYRLKQYDEAIESFTIALRLDPRRARAYEGRAFAYRAKGDQEHAKADFDELQRIKDGH